MLKCVSCQTLACFDSLLVNNLRRGIQTSATNFKSKNILFLNVSHGPQSLVGVGAKAFLENLKIEKSVTEINLWKEDLVNYRLDHTMAKNKVMKSQGTAEDIELFAPVKKEAERLNTMDIVVIATPMWNYSVPYVLKQYIDTLAQPGINYKKKSGADRILVVVSSAGAYYPADSIIKDLLNPYLQQIFYMMGFTKFHKVFIEGAMMRDKKECIDWTLEEAKYQAEQIQQILKSE